MRENENETSARGRETSRQLRRGDFNDRTQRNAITQQYVPGGNRCAAREGVGPRRFAYYILAQLSSAQQVGLFAPMCNSLSNSPAQSTTIATHRIASHRNRTALDTIGIIERRAETRDASGHTPSDSSAAAAFFIRFSLIICSRRIIYWFSRGIYFVASAALALILIVLTRPQRLSADNAYIASQPVSQPASQPAFHIFGFASSFQPESIHLSSPRAPVFRDSLVNYCFQIYIPSPNVAYFCCPKYPRKQQTS